MQLVEFKFDKSIDKVILEGMVSHHGVQKELAKDMDICESALSRWIADLGLSQQVSKIRQSEGLPPSPRDLEAVNKEGKALLSLAVNSSCTKCGKSLEDMFKADIQGFVGDKVVTRDELDVKHWFIFDSSLINKHTV